MSLELRRKIRQIKTNILQTYRSVDIGLQRRATVC